MLRLLLVLFFCRRNGLNYAPHQLNFSCVVHMQSTRYTQGGDLYRIYFYVCVALNWSYTAT